MDERFTKRSVERVKYVINNLLHLVIVKYGVILLVLCISTRLRLVTILTSLVKYKYHVIFHADPCNKSYISREILIKHPSVGLALLTQLEKWFPLWGERIHSLKKICFESNINKIDSFFALPSSSVSRANLSSVVFSSLAFLSSSVSMASLSRLVATSFSSFALLSSSLSTANLSCLLATTYSSLYRFLSNSFSSPRFNLLREARRCFSFFLFLL